MGLLSYFVLYLWVFYFTDLSVIISLLIKTAPILTVNCWVHSTVSRMNFSVATPFMSHSWDWGLLSEIERIGPQKSPSVSWLTPHIFEEIVAKSWSCKHDVLYISYNISYKLWNTCTKRFFTGPISGIQNLIFLSLRSKSTPLHAKNISTNKIAN